MSGDQEPRETLAEGEEEVVPLESTAETPSQVSPSQLEEQEGAESQLTEQDDRVVDQNSLDSEPDSVRELVVDDARLRETR